MDMCVCKSYFEPRLCDCYDALLCMDLFLFWLQTPRRTSQRTDEVRLLRKERHARPRSAQKEEFFSFSAPDILGVSAHLAK